MAHLVSRRGFLRSSLAATAYAGFAPRLLGARRPNILFILADDLGYGDPSCYGRPDYRTPHIDRLAREGLRFTSNYTAAAAVCTPTRVALMTPVYGISGVFYDIDDVRAHGKDERVSIQSFYEGSSSCTG